MSYTGYLGRMTRRGGFSTKLPVYLARMAHFALLRGFSRESEIRVRFGEKYFLMRVLPLGPKEGSRGIFLFRENYESLLSVGHRLLKPGDIALDVGANQGIYCCAFGSAVGPGGRVVAVEPIPRQAQRLKSNIEANGFKHCSVIQKAISDCEGVATLGLADGYTSASILAADKRDSITVETISVDEIVKSMNLPRVDFIKLDVEGAELLALRGGINTLRQFRPTLSIEAFDSVLFEDIRTFLEPLGYKFGEFDKTGRIVPFRTLTSPIDNVIWCREDIFDQLSASPATRAQVNGRQTSKGLCAEAGAHSR
jgi:FkbM family methyltransferase